MDQVLFMLKTIPEYGALVQSLNQGASAAVTGIGQINRSHLIAGLSQELTRPLVILVQDEMAARKLQEELKCFLGTEVPVLPGRELTLYDAAVVSRAWEQKRLRQLYALGCGDTPIQILSWESASQRTLPPSVLSRTTITLEIGKEYQIQNLIASLVAAGYSRCGMVEGVGQFALRGGILDIFSPAYENPSVRNSLATSWTPWASLTPAPSGGKKTQTNASFFRSVRLCPTVTPARWRGSARTFAA